MASNVDVDAVLARFDEDRWASATSPLDEAVTAVRAGTAGSDATAPPLPSRGVHHASRVAIAAKLQDVVPANAALREALTRPSEHGHSNAWTDAVIRSLNQSGDVVINTIPAAARLSSMNLRLERTIQKRGAALELLRPLEQAHIGESSSVNIHECDFASPEEEEAGTAAGVARLDPKLKGMALALPGKGAKPISSVRSPKSSTNPSANRAPGRSRTLPPSIAPGSKQARNNMLGTRGANKRLAASGGNPGVLVPLGRTDNSTLSPSLRAKLTAGSGAQAQAEEAMNRIKQTAGARRGIAVAGESDAGADFSAEMLKESNPLFLKEKKKREREAMKKKEQEERAAKKRERDAAMKAKAKTSAAAKSSSKTGAKTSGKATARNSTVARPARKRQRVSRNHAATTADNDSTSTEDDSDEQAAAASAAGPATALGSAAASSGDARRDRTSVPAKEVSNPGAVPPGQVSSPITTRPTAGLNLYQYSHALKEAARWQGHGAPDGPASTNAQQRPANASVQQRPANGNAQQRRANSNAQQRMPSQDLGYNPTPLPSAGLADDPTYRARMKSDASLESEAQARRMHQHAAASGAPVTGGPWQHPGMPFPVQWQQPPSAVDDALGELQNRIPRASPYYDILARAFVGEDVFRGRNEDTIEVIADERPDREGLQMLRTTVSVARPSRPGGRPSWMLRRECVSQQPTAPYGAY